MKYIRDDEFIRGDCPMTKEEIRIISIAKMELREDSNVLDVGAGTGSVTVQAAKIATKGKVIGIEKDEAALETIYKNIEKFQAINLKVLEGNAMEHLKSMNEKFDSIFVGGSSGELEEIIEESLRLLKDEGIMVLNFITINNLYTAMKKLKDLNCKVECTQISVSKTRGQSYMLMGMNPIFILTARK